MINKTNANIRENFNLPVEILIQEIFKYLDEKDLIKLSLLNKRMTDIVRNNVFWKFKFRLHFDHRLTESSHSDTNNWYTQFAEATLHEYSKSTRFKHLFFISKEGNSQSFERSLQQGKFKIHDLIEVEDNNYLTPLDWLIRKGHQHVLNFIFENVQKIFCKNETKKLMTKDRKGFFLIHWAILCNQPDEVIQAYSKDEAFIKYPLTPFHLAAKFGLNEKIELFHNLNHIKYGQINSHLYLSFFSSKFSHQTPLHFAAAKGHSKTVTLLLDKGAEKDAPMIQYHSSAHGQPNNLNITPLHLAAHNNQINVVKIFLEKGCLPLTENDWNNSALLYAINNNHSNLFFILLEKTAKQDGDNNALNRALFYAVKNNLSKFIQPLLDKGANPFWKNPSEDLRFKTAIDVAAYLASSGQNDPLSILISNRKKNSSLNIQTPDTWKIGALSCFVITLLTSGFIVMLMASLKEYNNVDININRTTFFLLFGTSLLCSPIVGALGGTAYAKYVRNQSQFALEKLLNETTDLEQKLELTPLLNSEKELDIEKGLPQDVPPRELTINNTEPSLQKLKKFMFLDRKVADVGGPESSGKQDADEDEIALIRRSKR